MIITTEHLLKAALEMSVCEFECSSHCVADEIIHDGMMSDNCLHQVRFQANKGSLDSNQNGATWKAYRSIAAQEGIRGGLYKVWNALKTIFISSVASSCHCHTIPSITTAHG